MTFTFKIQLVTLALAVMTISIARCQIPIDITGEDEVTNIYYNVQGNLQQVAQALGNRKYAGRTELDLQFKGQGVPREVKCFHTDGTPNGKHKLVLKDSDITVVKATAKITVEMPIWTNERERPEAAQTEWHNFWVALQQHEDGHVSLTRSWLTPAKIQEYMKDIHAASQCYRGAKKPTDEQSLYFDLDRQVEQKGDAFRTAVKQANNAYDGGNGNGTEKGTTINPTIDY